jgi:signal transduction histidine kinase
MTRPRPDLDAIRGGIGVEAEDTESTRAAGIARGRVRDMRKGGLVLLLVTIFAILALATAHFVATYLLVARGFEPLMLLLLAVDAILALLLIAAVAWHLHRLTQERSRHAVIEAFVEALSVPASIEATGQLTVGTLIGAGIAQSGLLAVVSSGGDAESDRRLLPLAVSGARRGWEAEPSQHAGRMSARPTVQRERVTSDRWLLGFEVNVGRTPWVARIPIRSGDEELALLLLASRRRGWLGDEGLLLTIAAILGAALDHGRQYQVAFERTRELEAENTRRREFLYAIAHELRSPLTSIQAFAELLTTDRALVDGNQELLLASLSRGVDRLSTFVTDLLDLGRVEESSMRVRPTIIDVTDALRGAETILRPAFMARDQALTLDLPEEGLLALGDERALEQVMLNLLSNANRYTPAQGAVSLSASFVDDRVHIEVCDSGPGIDPADRERVFEPFYRVHRPGVPEVPGSGLGLAVARRLTELQGGRIWIDNADGGGTRFCIELPTPPIGAVPTRAASATPTMLAPAASTAAPQAPEVPPLPAP